VLSLNVFLVEFIFIRSSFTLIITKLLIYIRYPDIGDRLKLESDTMLKVGFKSNLTLQNL